MKTNILKRKINDEFESFQITAKDVKFFIENLTLEKSDLEFMKSFINKFGYIQIDKFLKLGSNKDLSLLNIIANKGHLDLLKYLIEELTTQVNSSLNDRISTIKYAIRNKNLLNFQYLLDRENKYQSSDYQHVIDLLLASAIKSDNAEIVELMLKNGANITSVDMNGYTPLVTAVFYGNVKITKILFESCKDNKLLDTNNFNTVSYAAKNGHLDLVKLLIQYTGVVDLFDDDINYIYIDKSFNTEEFIEDECFHGDSSFKENYPIIRNLLLAVFWWQTILSGDLNKLLYFHHFILDYETKDLFKTIFINKINSAEDFKEISLICKNIILGKEDALNFLKSFNNKFSTGDESLDNSIIYEELIAEIIEEVITPIYGEDNIGFKIPSLSLLTLIKALANYKNLLEFFKTNPFAIDKTKVAIKAKLVNEKQGIELNSVFAKISSDKVDGNQDFETSNYHNDYTVILGDDANTSNI